MSQKESHKHNNLDNNGEFLPLVEEFYSIQGEGFHTGKAAYFIRIGGCDIGCSWCDTKSSWNPDIHPLVNVENIVKNVIINKADSVVVTGGEPSLYNLTVLCNLLKKNNIKTFVETSGIQKLTGHWDWVCLSPKLNSPPLSENYTKANELKVIISNENDFIWAEQNRKLINNNCKLFLQPEWSVYNNMIQKIVDYVLKNPAWNISLQSHKFMHIP